MIDRFKKAAQIYLKYINYQNSRIEEKLRNPNSITEDDVRIIESLIELENE